MVEALKPDGIDVTLSIGVAQLEAGEEGFACFLKRADQALYQAKEGGRNCVVLA